MRVSGNRCLAFALVAIVLLLLAACSSPKSPDDVVRQMFEAYRKDNSGVVDGLMTEQGKDNADAYCNGHAINCLRNNYKRHEGDLSSFSVSIISETDTYASVHLRTVWSGEEKEYCQTFELDKVKGKWGVTYFNEPWYCPQQ